jgi:hypothetical protein
MGRWSGVQFQARAGMFLFTASYSAPGGTQAISSYLRQWLSPSDLKVLWWSGFPFFLYFFYYLICEAIGTSVTPGLLYQPRVIVKMIVEKQMECRLTGETEVLGENLPQRHFCPSQNPTWPHDQTRVWTWAAAGGSRRLTAWSSSRFFLLLFCLWGYWHCGHSWPIEPASGESEDDCGEADGM